MTLGDLGCGHRVTEACTALSTRAMEGPRCHDAPVQHPEHQPGLKQVWELQILHLQKRETLVWEEVRQYLFSFAIV